MPVLKLMRIVLIITAFLTVFLPVYVNISAFAIEPDEEDTYIVLLDEGREEIHEDGSYTSTVHVKYKILKEDALHSLGEKKIGYFSATEDVDIIKAVVIKPNGRKIRAKKIQDVSPYSGYALYSDLKTKIITMRDLAVGDILELKYRVNSRHSRMPGEVWGGFCFFDTIPMDVSRFILRVPATKEIHIKGENLDMKPVITYSKDGSTKTYTWERRDCPKIEREYMMPDVRDFCPYLTYSTIDDWQKIATWYWNISKDKIMPTPQITEETMRITATSEHINDKIRDLLRYFQDDIRYVSMSFGLNAFEPHPASEVLENKYGDCKDQSVLLIAMLKVLGIDAYPVMVRYGQNTYSLDRAAPSPAEFTHVIVYADVEGQDLWLDPLVEGVDLGDVLYSLTEERVFVVRPEGGEFIDIPAMPLDKIGSTIKTTIFLQPDGSCTGSLESIISYKKSPSFRSKLKDFTAKQMDLFKARLLNRIAPGGEIIDTYISDPDDYSRPCSVMIKFKTDDWAPLMGDFMILPSLSPSFDNPFDLPESERDHPIRYSGKTIRKSIAIVNIPEGFHFEYIPENYEVSLPICRYTLTSQPYNGRLVMVAESQWFPGKIPVEDYVKVQDFFNDLQSEASKVIIIKRGK